MQEIVRTEVQKDPNLLQRDRSKSAILMGGAVDRYNIIHDLLCNVAGLPFSIMSSAIEIWSLMNKKLRRK